MRIADIAQDFGADHAMGGVDFFPYVARVYRLEIAGPAAARVELGVGHEQGRPAADATINAGAIEIPVSTGERSFGSLVAGNNVFVRGKRGTPLGVRFDDFIGVAHSDDP